MKDEFAIRRISVPWIGHKESEAHALTLVQTWTTYDFMNGALQLKQTLASTLREKMASDQLTIAGFARQTKTGRNAIRRILDPRNTSITLLTMAKTAKALNLELSLSARPLPLAKLEPLAVQLASATDARTVARLKKQFLAGYYGNAQNPAR